jgi:uncharacterized protein (DUF302 family)
MTTTVRDFSFSARTGMPYRRVLSILREALKRHGFEVLCELPLDRELERKVGLQCQHCTVFVIWSPFDAYQAVISDRDGGLLVPFNITVAEHESSTVIAATNHAALSRNGGSIGVQVLVQTLAKKVRRIFLELATQENVPEHREVPGSAMGL